MMKDKPQLTRCYVICKTPVKCEREIPVQSSMVGTNRAVFRTPEDPTPIKCVWCGATHNYFQADVRKWDLYFTETVVPSARPKR